MKKLAITLFLITFSTAIFSQDVKYKSLFIYNFTKHIEWPSDYKTGDFIICVLGKPELANSLTGLTNGKSAGSQKIVVKSIGSPSEIGKCNILFVSASHSGGDKMDEVVASVGANSTLIVTERNGYANKGAAINFIMQAGKIKFELNKATISKHKLKVSSYLENMAIVM